MKNADKTACANSQVVLTIDGEQQQTLTTDGEGKLTVTLTKGAHYLKLANSTNFVYVNNYSGTGLEYTKDGYYTFAFLLA